MDRLKIKRVYVLIGIALLALSFWPGVRLGVGIGKLFLPTWTDIAWLAGLALGTAACLAAGVRFLYIGIKTSVIVKKNADREELSETASDLPAAAEQISVYLSIEKEVLFRADLIKMQQTIMALEDMFAASKQVVLRRFFNGLTATKFQIGLDALYSAILDRLNKQMLQLCAVNTAELVNRADSDEECKRSIEKLKAYVYGTKLCLDQSMGLGTRLTLELIDCTEDVLQEETDRLMRLTAELEAYKK